MADNENQLAIPLLAVSTRDPASVTTPVSQAAAVHQPASRDSPATSSSSPWTRTGTIAISTLIISTSTVAACICFLYFLWYGTPDNLAWHRIVMSNWVPPTITLTSAVLRTALTLQGGVCLSMLAAIALERSAVPLASVGSVSLMRAGGDKGLVPVLTDFAWPLFRRGPRLEQLILPTVLLTLSTMSLSQLISTALVSDVAIQLLPSYNETVNVAYDIAYNLESFSNYTAISGKSLWGASIPSQWPTFAEYSEPPVVQDNVSDTGLNLRAFLPLGAQERQLLRNYTGKALVLDTRVTCQQPVLAGVEFDTASNYITGRISPTTSTPRLDAADAVPFNCLMIGDAWTICELYADAIRAGFVGDSTSKLRRQPYQPSPPQNFSGGLVSEFREFPPSPGQNKSGAALLLSFLESDVSIKTGTEFVTRLLPEYYNFTYHVTLCYTSFDFADRWINAYGDVNRTEPTLTWSATSWSPVEGLFGDYNKTAVAAQLDAGYTSSSPPTSPRERGVMSIQAPMDWSAAQSDQPANDGPSQILTYGSSPPELPWLTSHLHISDPAYFDPGMTGELGNYSVSLYHGGPTYGFNRNTPQTSSDAWLGALFGYVMEKRSSSVALQAVITTLAGIDYYNYLAQFDKSDNVSMVSFVNANTPGGPLGKRRTATPRGLTMVTVLSVVHTTLVVTAALRFWSQTTNSRIGDSWQAIAQVALSDIGILNDGLRAAMMPGARRDVLEKLEEKPGVVSSHVCLAEDGECVKLEIR